MDGGGRNCGGVLESYMKWVTYQTAIATFHCCKHLIQCGR